MQSDDDDDDDDDDDVLFPHLYVRLSVSVFFFFDPCPLTSVSFCPGMVVADEVVRSRDDDDDDG